MELRVQPETTDCTINVPRLTKAVWRPVASWGQKSYDSQISLTPTIRDNVVHNSVTESVLNARHHAVSHRTNI